MKEKTSLEAGAGTIQKLSGEQPLAESWLPPHPLDVVIMQSKQGSSGQSSGLCCWAGDLEDYLGKWKD